MTAAAFQLHHAEESLIYPPTHATQNTNAVSGYESTAQCIENMQTPTFLKVLRNLWVGSSMINPTLALLAISVLPIAEISANRWVVVAVVVCCACVLT